MKIFLCVPFSSMVDENDRVLKDYQKSMESVISHLRSKGHTVFCALEYTGWKLGGDTPADEELAYDFQQITDSDLVIAMLEEKVSAGVQLENGYAYALGKNVHIYQSGKAAWSNMAFSKLSGNDFRPINDYKDFADQVKSSVEYL